MWYKGGGGQQKISAVNGKATGKASQGAKGPKREGSVKVLTPSHSCDYRVKVGGSMGVTILVVEGFNRLLIVRLLTHTHSLQIRESVLSYTIHLP